MTPSINIKSKPSLYSSAPYHAVRSISLLSAVIVAGIVAFFCHQLWSDKYKIPWTFIIVLIAALANIAALMLTSIISCCGTLSPIFSILIDIPVLIVWIVAISLLTWNMYGALGHTCSITNWGNDRGIMVCQIYKTLYSFIIFANLSHIAQIVLDVRARRTQVGRGKYDKMRDSQEIKIDDLKPAGQNTVHEMPLASESSLQQQFRDDQQAQERIQPEALRDEMPGWRPGQRPAATHAQSYTSSSSGGYSNSHRDRHSPDRSHYGFDNSSSVQMQDFSYQRPHQATHYDAGYYDAGHHGGYGHGYNTNQQNAYYQSRY